MKVGSLFAGIGGFDLAARWMGWETAWFSEVDPYASAVLKKHWPNVPNHGDITQINGRSVEPVDLLCGGFPCQDISVANPNGKGLDGERSGLWREYERIIRELAERGEAPRWIAIENSPRLRSKGIDRILRDLCALGYDAEWHCIPASAVGAPHQRDRVWILAYPNGQCEQSVFAGCWPQGSCEVAPDWALDLMEPSLRARSAWTSDVADCGGAGLQGHAGNGDDEAGRQIAARSISASGLREGAGEVCNSASSRLSLGAGESVCGPEAVEQSERSGGWPAEPNVGRVANGVPARVDRIKCLGNAVVPRVPLLIFIAIAIADAQRAALQGAA